MPGKDASQGNTTASLSRNVLSVTGLVPATSAMILYDCLLTFVSELELFWLKPSKGFAGTLLFGLNRLAAIVWIISENSGPGPPAFSHPSCKASVLLEAASTVLVNAIWGAISAVRVHALTRRSWFLSASTFLLAVAPISVTYGIVSNKVDTYKMGQTQVCVLISDLVVLLVTLHHTRPRHLIMLPKRSLTGVLCKDGTLYFIALTILNALALIIPQIL
ncbi:uncharacterized protein C8Q71DRAFT_393098 [Rhodofomes roseus]|uniref:DUF6533 domain-containing protein n=1 Tax=Rhodofomes roseus TaxID=34475 RepID=A0ABQ8JZX8_9APHY|nr:uncharacterized protein C8Q71DRAFT_393098 [Rhodofomes roseus]KAH9829889.1 hypothetical protein C8Q71DRAFT_393098 [Rhodofomes roseus]